MSSNDFTKELRNAVQILRRANIDARGGLPEELFLLISSLSPIPNVDLLITDKQGRLLLSRRNDAFFGDGWHIPGGCIRFGETMEQRIQATARTELKCEVFFEPVPIAVCDVFCESRPKLKYPNERRHHLAIMYQCYLPDGYEIDNRGLTEYDPGYLKWFFTLPDDFLRVHDVYLDYLKPWIRRK